MKKVLLATAALAALAAVPAKADEPALQLGLGGYISGYAVYNDQDGPTGTEYRNFDFRKDTEVHLSGEVALDNGITAGAHLEMLNDRNDDSAVEESYLYLSSSWGRVNLGEEDGIAYLIQVAPPTADDKIDGPRPDISSVNIPALSSASTGTGLGATTLDYAQDPFGYTNKFTYITPVFNGFQAGFSYTPSASEGDLGGTAAAAVSNSGDDFEDGMEFAARYEGSFDAIDVAIGAGYSTASLENEAASVTFTDDLKEWNAGVNIGYGAFGLGAAYVTSNNGFSNNGDMDGWVVGADYVTGPYKVGVSYTDVDLETAAAGLVDTGMTDDVNISRWTAGGIYEWGPGMTFRGAVSYYDLDTDQAGDSEDNATQVTLGTQLTF